MSDQPELDPKCYAAISKVFTAILDGDGALMFDPKDFIPKRIFGLAVSAEIMQDLKALSGSKIGEHESSANKMFMIDANGDIKTIKAKDRGKITLQSSLKDYVDSKIEYLKNRLYDEFALTSD